MSAQRFRNVRLIAGTPALEAWRRREIYAVVLVTVLLLVGLRFVDFFDMPTLGKFYREISLKVMNLTTGAAVILLAARQLPREFNRRTIYPLLAKPVGRMEFLLGKYLGVLFAGAFCYALFMAVFLLASWSLQAPVNMALFAQAVYLQIVGFAVLAALVFFLSLLLHVDAAITLSAVLFVASQILMNLMSYLYEFLGEGSRVALLALHFVIPQLTLFDASAKVVHSVDTTLGAAGIEATRTIWEPIGAGPMLTLTLYGLAYVVVFLGLTHLLFRRKAL